VDSCLQENASVPPSPHENESSDSLSLFCSEKAVQEILQPPLQGIDEHLVEFSEAMRSMFYFFLQTTSHDSDVHCSIIVI